MPLLAQSTLPIPTKDILSWCWENRSSFDQDKLIYVDAANPKRCLSANQAWVLIRQLVAGFRAAGLKPGDTVCIHAFNDLYYPILVQGIIGAGGVWVGTNPAYTPFELHHALKVSKAKFVIVEPELLGAVEKPAAGLNIQSNNILILSESATYNHQSWKSLLSHGAEDWVAFDHLETAKNTTAFLMFSSGTTGLPKAAQLSHYNLIAEHTLVHENPEHLEPFEMSRLMPMPFFHAGAAPSTHTSTLRSGRPTYVMRRFELHSFLSHIARFQITGLILVPPMVVAIVNLAKEQPEHVRKCLRSIRLIVGGAAPLDKDTQNALQALLPPEGVFTQVWAMTEVSCVASNFYYPERDATGSVGRFMPNLHVKIVDDDGNEVGPYDTRGELCVRGPTVSRGYLDIPEANARDWDGDGYFHTGDIVYADGASKLFYVVDRRKELMKVRGFQVAPSELEGVLLGHPGIRDVAVIGVDGGRDVGELPRAYVIRQPGAEALTEAEVKKWIEDRLSRFKRLDGGVRFVETIPKSASGKILKRIMREEARREMGAKL